jgi:hypothetical protein
VINHGARNPLQRPYGLFMLMISAHHCPDHVALVGSVEPETVSGTGVVAAAHFGPGMGCGIGGRSPLWRELV